MKPTLSTKYFNSNRLLEDFFEKLSHAPSRYLLLDYDGTLAPFNIDLNKAFPYPGVRERIDTIMSDHRNHVIIITGRWIRDLVPLLGLRQQPEVWGSHGWEHLLPGGVYAIGEFEEDALQSLAEVDGWTDEITARGGRCEHKPGCLAVHWRGLAQKQIQSLCAYIQERWLEKPEHPGLGWHGFEGGVEIRVLGRHKGNVMAEILAGIPEGAVCAFLGDDASDEDAFYALHGRGLTVLVEVWLRPPAGLLTFLDRWMMV